MSLVHQVRLLLWKNFTLRRRSLGLFISEVISPIVCAVTIWGLTENLGLQAAEWDPYQPKHSFRKKPLISMEIPNLAYVPNSPPVDQVMKNLKAIVSIERPSDTFETIGFSSVKEAEDHIKEPGIPLTPWFVVFQTMDGQLANGATLPKQVNYVLRPVLQLGENFNTYEMLPSEIPDTIECPQPRLQNLLQYFLSKAITLHWTKGGNMANIGFEPILQCMPFQQDEDILQDLMASMLSYLIISSFFISVVVVTKTIVEEKELNLKETMMLMGLTKTTYWLSWFVTFQVQVVIVVTWYTICLCVTPVGADLPPLSANPILVFIFLFLYGTAVTTFCLLVSTLVHTGTLATFLSSILYLASIYPGNSKDSKMLNFLSAFSFNSALKKGINVFVASSTPFGGEINFGNFAKVPYSLQNDLSLLEVIIMLAVDSVLHLLQAWYMEQVYPGPHGVAKPFFFCVKKPEISKEVMKSVKNKKEMKDDRLVALRFFEPPHDASATAGIEMVNLRKEFGSKVSVHGTTLKMYHNQITVLLGHNGAGKTVTMSMLAGFIPPTSGTAFINGHNIKTERTQARQYLGLCPQLNVLFDFLTVEEQLTFFATLKGFTEEQAQWDVKWYIRELGLNFKSNEYAGNLSGGWKRKLSVGIALVGGSKVVILDEPTAGMDPANRRQTWSVLKRARQDRTILMTTHYMDEADLLGDRIAIMSAGEVRCCGSSIFLKRIYGSGYYLVLTLLDGCDLTSLEDLITLNAPGAQLDKIERMEAMYLLPDEDVKGFEALFLSLEEQKDELRISGFGISTTSMEQVFIRVNEGLTGAKKSKSLTKKKSSRQVAARASSNRNSSSTSDIEDNSTSSSDESSTSSDLSSSESSEDSEKEEKRRPQVYFKALKVKQKNSSPKKSGLGLYISVVRALLIKRVIYMKRRFIIHIMQLIVPVVLLLFVLDLTSKAKDMRIVFSAFEEEKLLVYDLKSFESARVFYLFHIGLPAVLKPFRSAYTDQFDNVDNVILEALPESLIKEQDFDDYLLDKTEELGRLTFLQKMPIGMRVEHDNTSSVSGTAYYNPFPHHAQEISLNYLLNAMAQYVLNDTTYKIQSSLYPFQNSTEENKQEYLTIVTVFGNKFASILLGVGVVFGVGFMGPVILQFLVYERKSGAKQMQLVSGADATVFWFSAFVVDFFFHAVTTLLIILLIVVIDIEAYKDNLFPTTIALFLWDWALVFLIYLFQFLFNSPNSGSVFLVVYNIVTGMVSMLVVSMARLLGSFTASETIEYFTFVVELIFQIFIPTFNIGSCFVNILENFKGNEYCKSGCSLEEAQCCKSNCTFCVNYEENYFSMATPGIGQFLLALFCQGLVFLGIILFVDCGLFERLWYCCRCKRVAGANALKTDFGDEDSDVEEERKRINSYPISHFKNYGPGVDQLSLVNLYKCYGTHVAVDHLCVGIPHGECFGLLGQNGAGKTTTFKMLTGDVRSTAGKAYLMGHDVLYNFRKVQHHVGYCPQFDGLLWELTGRETLQLFARLRGLSGDLISTTVNGLLKRFLFEDEADTQCGVYSGGTKRKLNAAVAVMGSPPVILLDEPSWGMDPTAKRHMWDVLVKLRNAGHTMVLTSHSMEEVEALCTRLSAMVNGRMVCLGSSQHLKSKFSSGYTFIIQLLAEVDGPPADPEPVKDYVSENVPDCELFEEHQNYLHYQAPDRDGQLGRIFSSLENAKHSMPIADFNVQQTTLEQVFLSFTRDQVAPTEDTSRSLIN